MTMTIANVEMARAWDGEEGDQWTELADRYDTAGARHARHFIETARIGATDRVLDIGCGTGQSTRDAARRAVSGSVLGVDLSSRMLDCARERSRAEGLTNVEYVQADAQVHAFEKEAFDLAISRFGAMFFGEPVAAFTNIATAIRSGGRLVIITWQELAKNEWVLAMRDALAAGRTLPEPPVGAPGPFGLAHADEVRRVLTAAGFADVKLTAVQESMVFGADADDAWSFLSTVGIVKGLTDGLDDATKAEALGNLRRTIAAHETTEGVLFDSAAWLITADRSR